MNYLDWHVGMKVVFVGYPGEAGAFAGDKQIKRVPFLTVGKIYTILDMCVRSRYARSKWAGPSFYVGCDHVEYGRVWHHGAGFRPLESRGTDISIFTSMLNGAKERERA